MTSRRMRPTGDEIRTLAWTAIYTFVYTFVGGLSTVGLDLVDVSGLEVAAVAGAGSAVGVIGQFAGQKLGRTS